MAIILAKRSLPAVLNPSDNGTAIASFRWLKLCHAPRRAAGLGNPTPPPSGWEEGSLDRIHLVERSGLRQGVPIPIFESYFVRAILGDLSWTKEHTLVHVK